MKRKIITINTIAVLKHKHSDFEIHFRNDGFYTDPLNIFQKFLYWILGFEYVYGPDYIKLMAERMNLDGKARLRP